MSRITPAIAALSLCALGSAAVWSQRGAPESAAAPARAQVLVLGTYHMANPGRDVFNTRADDVLSPARQAEIEQVIAVLGEFGPTKIAVERRFDDAAVHRAYAEYLAGTREPDRSEDEQIGFRLARQLGHTSVHPVDVGGEFPFQALVKYVRASGRSGEFDRLMEEIGAGVEAQGAYLASHTILETLLYMNADARVARSVGTYYRLAQFGEPPDWAGPDLAAGWFRRNVRIFSRIVRLIDAPTERVLVIIGAGHLGWLQQAVAGSSNLRLRKLAEFNPAP